MQKNRSLRRCQSFPDATSRHLRCCNPDSFSHRWWSESGIQGLLTIEPGEGDVKDFVDHHMDSWSISAMIFLSRGLANSYNHMLPLVLGWEVGIVGLYKVEICLYIFCSPPPGPKKIPVTLARNSTISISIYRFMTCVYLLNIDFILAPAKHRQNQDPIFFFFLSLLQNQQLDWCHRWTQVQETTSGVYLKISTW